MEKQNLFPKDFCKQNDSESVLDTLYWSYFDRHPMDSVEISRQFSSLADILGKLTLKEHDQVWNLTCALCTEHEKKGFLEGVRTGATMVWELTEK